MTDGSTDLSSAGLAMRRLLPLLLLVALLLPNGSAWAHAVLLATSPAADSAQPQSPAAIELTFNEPVQLLALKLLDSTGRDVTPGALPTVTDGHVSWALPTALSKGRYLVSWRVGSLDGHVVSGSFGFAIGEATLPSAPAPSSAIDNWQWPGFVLHATARILALLAAGAVLFRLLLKPAAELVPVLRRRERRLALFGFFAQLLLIGAHGAMRAGLSIDGLWMSAAWQAALAAPGAWLDGLSLLGLLVLALASPRHRLVSPIEGLAALLALASFADSGHALAALPQIQGQALMLLHGLAAALWIGAFDPLRRAFARDAGPATASLFARFQQLGFWAVLAVSASGGTMAWLLIPRWDDLWQSRYGLTLSAKLLAVLSMLAIAGLNRFWLTPRALAGAPAMKRRLLLVLRLDLVLALIAVLLAVGLSLGPPPVASRVVELNDAKYAITLTLSPGRAGDNSAEIRIAMPDGMPIDPQKVQIRAESPAASIGPSIYDARRIAPGLYRIADLPLWAAGAWTLRINLMIDDFTMVSRDMDLTLSR
jgi:copper transport protein